MVMAIDAWRERAERRRIDAAIVEGYTRIPQAEDDDLRREAKAALERSIAEEPLVSRGEVWGARVTPATARTSC